MSRSSHTSPLMESRLRELLEIPLSLTLTDNTRSMITVRWKNGSCVVRLHQMFLDAAEDVLRVLAAFIRRPSVRQKSFLKTFIKNHEGKIRAAGIPSKPRNSRPHPEGTHVDLGGCFQRLNANLFRRQKWLRHHLGNAKKGTPTQEHTPRNLLPGQKDHTDSSCAGQPNGSCLRDRRCHLPRDAPSRAGDGTGKRQDSLSPPGIQGHGKSLSPQRQGQGVDSKEPLLAFDSGQVRLTSPCISYILVTSRTR